MSQQPHHATLFAYRVGFGDCFLLRFEYAQGQRRHVLIDFGTTSLPDDVGRDHMADIARDIAAKCHDGGDGLDAIVATHRHADHISGFATRADKSGSGDIIATLNPKVVIQPWTEAPKAPVDWEGPTGSSTARSFASHRRSLQAMQQASQAALDFVDHAGSAIAPAVAAQLRFIGEDNLSNLSAVKNLMKIGARHEYVFHGCALDLSAELPGISIDVLGPPTLRQTETIRKQRSRDSEEFWHLAAHRMTEAAEAAGTDRLFPRAKSFPATRMPVETRWLQRRIDETNAEMMLSLVRALDKQMNNTSVILLLRAGRKSLLFPGDAQMENWAYSLQSSLAELLDDVDLYKVGHHGSLNATPKRMWNRFAKRGSSRKRDRLTSVVSTKAGKHGSEAKHTEVPRKSLMKELRSKSTLYSTEFQTSAPLCEVIDIAL